MSVTTRNGSLELLRMISIFFIVGIHLQNNYTDVLNESLLFNHLSRIAVPIFFYLSAYFYCGRSNINTISRLSMYFVIVSLLYYFANLIIPYFGIEFYSSSGFLWFLVALIIMEILTLYQKDWWLIFLIIVSMAIIVALDIKDISYKEYYKFVQYLPWFCIIILFRKYAIFEKLKIKSLILPIILMALTSLLCFILPVDKNVNMACFLAFLFFLFWQSLPSLQNRKIYSYSQGIYYFHQLIISIFVSVGLYHFEMRFMESINLFVTVSFVYGIAILITIVLRKIPFIRENRLI